MNIIISERGNFCARIIQDEYAENPRDVYYHMGRIVHASSRYYLGDDCISPDEIRALTKRSDIVYLPVYALVHSGTWLSTTPFSCHWDSWQSGIIYVEKEALRKEWNVKRLTQKHIREAQKMLESEVEEFSAYLSGDVWEYQLFRVPDDIDLEDVEDATCEAWEPIDSLCGLYGYNYAEKEAAAALASLEASLAAQPAQLTLPGLPTNQRGHVLPYGGSHAAA